jgi:hypothetical protein
MVRGAATDKKRRSRFGESTATVWKVLRSCDMVPPLSRLRPSAEFGLAYPNIYFHQSYPAGMLAVTAAATS